MHMKICTSVGRHHMYKKTFKLAFMSIENIHTDIDKPIISNETGVTQGAGITARELRGE